MLFKNYGKSELKIKNKNQNVKILYGKINTNLSLSLLTIGDS